MWLPIVLSLLAAVSGIAAGRWSGVRAGRKSAWVEAQTHYAAITEQLDNDERELSHRREVDHAQVRNPHWRNNGAGYRSHTSQDSPARLGGATPNKETDVHAKTG